MIHQLAPLLLIACLAALGFSAACSLAQWRRPQASIWVLLSRLGLGLGAACLIAILATSWIELGRPPLRTLGETRLWYASLLLVAGLSVELIWQTSVLRLPMIFFGLLFAALCLAHPEHFDAHLMPALRSAWFVPHVTVYLFAYACLGLAAGAAARAWHQGLRDPAAAADSAALAEVLQRLGLLGLSCGLSFGALWAKEAWGHYWSWDPKETWAFLTWACYCCLLHLQPRWSQQQRCLAGTLAFGVVLGCWFLVNYLPAAQASVHTYAMPK
jgi:ABC-type transport system involved in cytochrome c biogenesis permease subunit